MRKRDPLVGKQRVDRQSLESASFAEAAVQDKEYWLKQTPHARLRALELMRRINYGQAAAGRL